MTKRGQVTQKQIAAETGVTQGIVSAVLRNSPACDRISDETRRRILETARRYHYPIYHSFRDKKRLKNNIIGIIIKKEQSQFYQDLIFLLNEELEKISYRTIISRVDLEVPDPELGNFIDRILNYNYAGVICIGHYSPRFPDLVPKKLEFYHNAVFLNMPRGIGEAPCVRIDYGAGVREAVNYLIKKGRKRIALCINDISCDATKGRFAGYCAGITENGLPVLPELCWCAEDYGMCAWEGDALDNILPQAMRALVLEQKPDAIIAGNDLWGVGLIHQLHRHRIKVPQEIAVVGYGDFHYCCWSCTPQLASINHGNKQIVAELIRMIDDLIRGQRTRDEISASPVDVKSFFQPRMSV